MDKRVINGIFNDTSGLYETLARDNTATTLIKALSIKRNRMKNYHLRT